MKWTFSWEGSVSCTRKVRVRSVKHNKTSNCDVSYEKPVPVVSARRSRLNLHVDSIVCRRNFNEQERPEVIPHPAARVPSKQVYDVRALRSTGRKPAIECVTRKTQQIGWVIKDEDRSGRMYRPSLQFRESGIIPSYESTFVQRCSSVCTFVRKYNYVVVYGYS